MASIGGRFPKRSRCLLCEGQMRRSGNCSLRHIQEHLQYKKYICQGCAYRCSTEDASMVHNWKSGHRMMSRENDYLEMLSSKIYMDCLHAADFGIEPVLSAMRNDSFNRSRIVEEARSSKTEGGSGDVVEVNVTERGTAAGLMVQGKEKEHGGGTELSDKEQGYHLHDSEEMTPNTAEKPPPVQAIGSGTKTNSESAIITEFADSARVDETCSASKKSKRRRQSSSEREIPTEQAAESHNIDITCRNESAAERALIDAGLKTDNPKKVSCRKCGKAVAIDYAHRRRHVTKHHHSDVSEKDFDEVLASEIRTCFPGCLVYSDIQCNECGREYKSESGRRYHAIRYHMQRMLKCVIRGCNVQEQSPAALKVHIQNDHQMAISSESNADVFRVFLCAKKKFDAALAAEVLRCFPIDLRSRTSNPLVPAPVGNDNDPSPLPSAPPASAKDDDARTEPDIDSAAFVSPVHPIAGSSSATMRNGSSVTRATVCNEQNGPGCGSRKRKESSSSSSDDSDSPRYAEAMRNRGCCGNASSPSPADDSALSSGRLLSKTTPSQASECRVPSSSTTAPVLEPTHPQVLLTPAQQAVARPLPSQSTMKRATPQREYQKRKVLLPFDGPQRDLLQQSRVAVDFSNIPRQYLTTSEAVDGLVTSNIRRSLVWEGVVNSSVSSHSSCAYNRYERFNAHPFEWSFHGDIHDSSVCARSSSNEGRGNVPNERRPFDRHPPARNRTFPPTRKKQSHRGGHSIRRDRGGLFVRSRDNKLEAAPKSLRRCKRLPDGGTKRRDTSGNSMYRSSAGRISKKTVKRSPLISKKKQLAKKNAAKAIVPHAPLTDAVHGDTGGDGRRSNTCSSPLVSKMCSEKWSGRRQQLGNQGGDKSETCLPTVAGGETEYREWYVKKEF